MWWIIIIVVIVVIIYRFTKDYNESIDVNVTRFGGMKIKYKTLVAYLIQQPYSKISEERRDHLSISSPSALFMIDNLGGDTEISMRSEYPILGKIHNKWKYPPGFPQEKMIEEIENFLDKKMRELDSITNTSDSHLIPAEKKPIYTEPIYRNNKPTNRGDATIIEYQSYFTIGQFKQKEQIEDLPIDMEMDSQTGEMYFVFGDNMKVYLSTRARVEYLATKTISHPMISLVKNNVGDIYYLLHVQGEMLPTLTSL